MSRSPSPEPVAVERGPVAPGAPPAERAEPVAIGLLVGLTALAVAWAGDLASSGLDGLRLDAWMQAQQAFSYEYEFVRRGLVGEVLRQVRYPDGPPAMFLLSAALYLVLAAVVGLLVWRAVRPLGRARARVATAVACALPFALPHFALDLGRYDAVLYLLALPLLLVRRRVPAPAYAAVALAGVLVHEVFLVVAAPLLILHLAADRGGSGICDTRVVALLGGCAVGAGAVALAGSLDSVPEARFGAELEARLPGYSPRVGPGNDPTHVILYQSLGDQVRATADDVSADKALDVALAAGPGLLLVAAHRRLRPGSDGARARRRLLLVLAPSLALFVTGLDATRWVALMSFDALVVLLLDVRAHPLDPGGMGRARAPLAALAATVALGPIGVDDAYPLLADALRHV